MDSPGRSEQLSRFFGEPFRQNSVIRAWKMRLFRTLFRLAVLLVIVLIPCERDTIGHLLPTENELFHMNKEWDESFLVFSHLPDMESPI